MWLLPKARFTLNDVIATTPFTIAQIMNVQLRATHANLLALMFFGARHTDEHAREHCTFIRFPKREVLTRLNTKGQR